MENNSYSIGKPQGICFRCHGTGLDKYHNSCKRCGGAGLTANEIAAL